MLAAKAFVIGLDCVSPKLFFKEYVNLLPNLKKLMRHSIWGKMESTMPPITCPAWMSMVTSKSPGALGIYGFRNRSDNSYDRMSIATSYAVNERTIWDILGNKGRKSVAIAVPPSYPPKKINGCMVGCFLSPDVDSDYTYPSSLKKEIKSVVGEYLIDVRKFRTEDKSRLMKEIYDLSENRFKTASYLAREKEWDFFMFVDMGPDRFHHGFWKYCDESHSKHIKGNKFRNAIKDYYIFLDKKIGEILKQIDDDTVVYIVSDHGAKKIDGCLCVNEWLIKKGYLKLKTYPGKITKLKPDMIDWGRTYAWGEGGYYGRIFFNVKGREPEGIIQKKDYKAFRKKIINDLENIKYIRSSAKKTIVHAPEDLYEKIKGVAPDLLVFFGDLYWRSAGSVGFDDIYTFDNDTGPDDANHDYHGVFLMYHKNIKTAKNIKNMHIYDFAPTVLNNMGIKPPKDMLGKPVKV